MTVQLCHAEYLGNGFGATVQSAHSQGKRIDHTRLKIISMRGAISSIHSHVGRFLQEQYNRTINVGTFSGVARMGWIAIKR